MRGDRGVEFTFIFNYTQKRVLGIWRLPRSRRWSWWVVVFGNIKTGGPPNLMDIYVWSIAIAKLVLAQKESQRCRSLILMPKLIDTHTPWWWVHLVSWVILLDEYTQHLLNSFKLFIFGLCEGHTPPPPPNTHVLVSSRIHSIL